MAVTPEGVISQSHINGLVARTPEYQRYFCDGCRREISRYVLDCKRCPPPGYDLVSQLILVRGLLTEENWRYYSALSAQSWIVQPFGTIVGRVVPRTSLRLSTSGSFRHRVWWAQK